jgi:hypothetical protein
MTLQKYSWLPQLQASCPAQQPQGGSPQRSKLLLLLLLLLPLLLVLAAWLAVR